MTSEEVRKLLKSYRDCKRIVLMKQELLREAEQNRDTLGAVNYEKVIVNGGLKESVVEKAAQRIWKIEEDFMLESQKLFDIEDSIRDMLGKLDVTEQNLVIDRYMNDLDFYKLSRKYFYTKGYIKKKFFVIYKKIARGNQR